MIVAVAVEDVVDPVVTVIPVNFCVAITDIPFGESWLILNEKHVNCRSKYTTINTPVV